jgi:hypothetical protein
MTTTTTFTERRELPERELDKESSVYEDNRKFIKSLKLDRESQISLFKIVSSFVVITMGLAGYWIAGLL